MTNQHISLVKPSFHESYLNRNQECFLDFRYLELTLEKAVRSQDKATSFNYALLGNQENAYTVLQFVKNRITAIREA